MLSTIKGIYTNGTIILNEIPPFTESKEVIVTFLDKEEMPKQRVFGSMKGQFKLPDDFNEPLEDLKDYM